MILKRMKRRHCREDVLEFTSNLRKIRSDVAFGADVIAGFPTETEDMFDNSLQLVKQAGIQYMHVFPYSEREGTPAARMPQLSKAIRKSRAAILRQAGEEELHKFLQFNVKTNSKVLVEKEFLGRTENFLPVKLDVAGIAGAIITVDIESHTSEHLLGRISS
jgi:threonylcarbamoyladenosine tRNA methylthiotransferase MtaB